MRPAIWIIFTAAILTACSSFRTLPDWVQAPPPDAVRHVLSGETILGRPVHEAQLPEARLFSLSPVMEATAEELAARHRRPYDRAKALHYKLLSSPMLGGFGIQHDARGTYPAAQAFARREVNCLSYTLMYVAMARHMGLDARVNDVALPPSWDLRGQDSLMLLRHVNAKVVLEPGEQVVIDLEMDRYSPMYRQSRVSERLAAALYYSNRASELAAEGKVEEGFLHLRKALALDDGQSYIWNNLGNLYYRQQLLKEAETAYLQGLHLAPRDLTVISNLSVLYKALGERDKAEYFDGRAREYRNDNPYYLYTRARSALNAGDDQKAETLVVKAIAREKKEPRFHRLAAQIYEHRGQAEKADSMRRRAEELEENLYLQ